MWCVFVHGSNGIVKKKNKDKRKIFMRMQKGKKSTKQEASRYAYEDWFLLETTMNEKKCRNGWDGI